MATICWENRINWHEKYDYPLSDVRPLTAVGLSLPCHWGGHPRTHNRSCHLHCSSRRAGSGSERTEKPVKLFQNVAVSLKSHIARAKVFAYPSCVSPTPILNA
jgi:hypothetical protein